MTEPDGPRGIDGVSRFMGMRWDSAETVRLEVRDELINAAGLLSGPVAFALVDYSMGSALWAQKNPGERIATINISINYLRTAREGEVVCSSKVDRRERPCRCPLQRGPRRRGSSAGDRDRELLHLPEEKA